MSVAETVALPAQPATGLTNYTPLGGNGFSAPQSSYNIQVTLACDASGGTNKITVTMDPQFTQLVSYVQTTIAGVAADTESSRSVGFDTFDEIHDHRPCLLDAGTTANMLWKPPGVMLYQADSTYDPKVVSTIENVDGDTHFLICRIYNFDKLARQHTPLSVLLANLPR